MFPFFRLDFLSFTAPKRKSDSSDVDYDVTLAYVQYVSVIVQYFIY